MLEGLLKAKTYTVEFRDSDGKRYGRIEFEDGSDEYNLEARTYTVFAALENPPSMQVGIGAYGKVGNTKGTAYGWVERSEDGVARGHAVARATVRAGDPSALAKAYNDLVFLAERTAWRALKRLESKQGPDDRALPAEFAEECREMGGKLYFSARERPLPMCGVAAPDNFYRAAAKLVAAARRAYERLAEYRGSVRVYVAGRGVGLVATFDRERDVLELRLGVPGSERPAVGATVPTGITSRQAEKLLRRLGRVLNGLKKLERTGGKSY